MECYDCGMEYTYDTYVNGHECLDLEDNLVMVPGFDTSTYED